MIISLQKIYLVTRLLFSIFWKDYLPAMVLLAILGSSSTSWAQVVRWSIGDGGNHHWYELIATTPASWSAAKTAAESLTVEGVPGHLATITSEDERLFIANNLTSGVAWLGGFQEGAGHTEPAGNWELVTGEPFVNFWNAGEPNNSPNESDCLELRSGGFNDRACSHSLAYLVEYDTAPPPPEAEAPDLTDASLDAGSEYGAATAMSPDGELAAVGAPSAQKVDIYRRVVSSPATWELEASLDSPNLDVNGGFGSALAFDPDPANSCLAVGAPGEDCMVDGSPIADCGAVHVFCNLTWEHAYTLSPPAFGVVPNPPASRGMNFGAAIAWAVTNSTTLVVGAPGRDSNFGVDAGEAYEFTISSPPVLTATLSDLLGPGDLSAGSEFGGSVDIKKVGSYRIAVGAPGYNAGTGRIVTFSSTSPLAREQVIDPSDGSLSDRFGAAVALSSNPHLAVGAPGHGGTGAVYLYEFSSPGTLLQKEEGTQPDCEFGASVAMSADGRILLVGGPGCSASPLRSGLVFQYFRLNPFTLVNTISPPMAEEDSEFGRSVTFGGNQFAVGEPSVPESLENAGTATIYTMPDDDSDGVPDGLDVCPGGDDNVDTDGDGVPDSCDSCPLDPDNDSDGDGVCVDVDNCPNTPNPNQSDTDGDGLGDACDVDTDQDGVDDNQDNCSLVFNPGQEDTDEDGIGDVCETDTDVDGVIDDGDQCPDTPSGEIVDADGCSVAQLCPCQNDWKNHGSYVRCVAHTTEDFVADGLITEAEKDTIVSDAGQSSCGSKK